MKIIKRNGAEEVFDIKKIVIAVTKADSSSEGRSLTDSQIEDIAEFVEFKCNKLNRAVSVEEIQDLVEDQIMATGAFSLTSSNISATVFPYAGWRTYGAISKRGRSTKSLLCIST